MITQALRNIYPVQITKENTWKIKPRNCHSRFISCIFIKKRLLLILRQACPNFVLSWLTDKAIIFIVNIITPSNMKLYRVIALLIILAIFTFWRYHNYWREIFLIKLLAATKPRIYVPHKLYSLQVMLYIRYIVYSLFSYFDLILIAHFIDSLFIKCWDLKRL